MFILVDQNEQATNPIVVERLRKVFPKLQIADLASGDINVILDDSSILAIERKRAGDFLGSIGDGRVFRQVEQMATCAKWSCIIIEGEITFNRNDMTVIDGEETKWRGTSVRGAMYAIQWAGCPIVTTNKYSFPQIVADVIQFCSKPSVHQQALGRKRIVTFPPISLNEEIVAAFPGVGLKLARSLIEFACKQNDTNTGTLAEALSWASCLGLIDRKNRPEGWGDKKITNFRVALGLNTNQYLDIKEDKQNGNKKSKPKRT